MSRSELIAELKRLAHVFENHPIHSDMSNTLRETVVLINGQQAEIEYWYGRCQKQFTPSPLENT